MATGGGSEPVREGALDAPWSRRRFITTAAALAGGAALSATLAGCDGRAASRTRRGTAPPDRPHGGFSGPPGHRGRIRPPGSRPDPRRPEGVDTLPQVRNIVVLMMENHSYDDHLGMLRRGDGLRLGRDGRPLDWNPDGKGNGVRSFRMPSGCQLPHEPSQTWDAGHRSFDGGCNDGFVEASGPVAMGHWDRDDLPFYYGMAETFPVCDRWFCSVLAQTYPNRRFLMAGTAAGIVSTSSAALLAPPPPNGTIFDRFAAHGISWRNYYSNLPSSAIIIDTVTKYPTSISPIGRFFADAAAGTLPAFSLVDPNFDVTSEENPQDVQRGEQFAARVIDAVMKGPGWPHTVLFWNYDEHGGYFDHVPPPPAIAPDDIPPDIQVPPDLPGGYDRYGFRVPAVIVSPFARRRYVSHRIHDHTSILKFVETKWNLGALTYRDANADDLLDSLDLHGRRPPFIEPPVLPPPALDRGAPLCTPGDPGGPIPPPDAVFPLREGTRTCVPAPS